MAITLKTLISQQSQQGTSWGCRAIEAVASVMSMQYGIIPPTINHENVDENIDPELNLTLNKPQNRGEDCYE